MDAIKFLEEYKRMCDSFENRVNYPLLTEACDNFKNPEFVKKVVPIVEEWSAAHPIKTRQDVFLEHWPETMIGDDGILQIDPCVVSATHRNKYGGCAIMKRKCTDCRREFWMQGVE